jgi:hypothetical protein
MAGPFSFPPSQPPSNTNVCSTKKSGLGVQVLTGIYSLPNGSFVEERNTGALLWCAPGSATLIASPPSGGATGGYDGMAGIEYCVIVSGVAECHGLILVLVTNANGGGFWVCSNATSSGCRSQSAFIPLPSSLCSSLRVGYCFPRGAALDSNLDLYIADSANAVVVKCLHSSGYLNCAVFEKLSGAPYGVSYLNQPTLYPIIFVTDSSCKGRVWENGKVVYQLGESLEGIGFALDTINSEPDVDNLFVGMTGSCSNSAGRIFDLDRAGPIASPFPGPNEIPAISSSLVFTTGGSAIKSNFTGKVLQAHMQYPKLITSIGIGAYIGGLADGAGGIFFANWGNGTLFHWDKSHGLVTIAQSPIGSSGYTVGPAYGLAAAKTSNGYRVAVLGWSEGSLYYCDGVNATKAASCSPYILIDPAFCASMAAGKCNPDGAAFDKNLNLYYVDALNNVEVELTAASGYTQASIYREYKLGDAVVNIFIDPSTGVHYVTDNSCSGHVYANGVLFATVGESLEAITMSSANPSGQKHLYVASTGICHEHLSHLIDLTDGKPLAGDGTPTYVYQMLDIPGISSGLYYSEVQTSNVYQAQDSW